jgi:hypothetical protein
MIQRMNRMKQSFEQNETVVVDIDTVTNATENGIQQQTVTIMYDDGPSVTLSGGGSIAEASGSRNITATLSATSVQDVTVNLGFSGTATLTDDYTRTGTSITIPAGSTTGSITITAVQDTLDETNETINVSISSVVNGTENGTQVQTVTITDDDAVYTPSVTLSGGATINEGSDGTITATLSGVTSLPVTVNLAFSGTATYGSDYVRSGPSIIIPAGSLSAYITITAYDDLYYEQNETVIVDINSVTNGTESGVQQQTITIANTTPQPTVTLSSSTASVNENGGTATITATLSAASYQNVTVNLAYSGDATYGTDYTMTGGGTPITITAGNTTGSLTLTSTTDAVDELDESATIDISSVTNGTENGTQQVTVTLLDNNGATVQLTPAPASPIAENGGTSTVTATLSASQAFTVTVYLDFTGTATYGTDYTVSGTYITIPAGSTTGTITITGLDDSLNEANETVIATISAVTNARTGATTSRTVTITNDDATQPTVTLSGGTSIPEGDSAVITATLSAVSGQDITVTLGYSGTATNTTDYTRSSGTIVIPAGSTTGTVTITSITDSTVEADETVVVDITGVTNGTENGTQQQTVTIVDAPTISSAQTLDLDGNGIIDHYRVTFTKAVLDSSFPGYVLNSLGNSQSQWLVFNRTNVVLSHGTAEPTLSDTTNDNVIYLKFDEEEYFDTADKPDLTTTSTPGLTDNTAAFVPLSQVSTADVSEADGAAPAIVRFHGALNQNRAYVDFSEPVDTDGGACSANLAAGDFTYHDDSAGNAASINNLSDNNACDQQARLRLNANITSTDTSSPFDKVSAFSDTSIYDAANNAALSSREVNLDPDCADSDDDGICDTIDNCPNDANLSQTDSNADGRGDACAFSNSATISIDTTATGAGMSGSTVTSFPVLVRLTSAESSIIQAVQNGAPDIRFIYNSDVAPSPNQTAYCSYEIESWDKATNTAAIWVLVPTIYPDSDIDYIKMWYNDEVNGAVIDIQDSTAVFATTNNFEAVWHMSQDPSGGAGAVLDSTANAYDGTSSGGMTSGDLVDSVIGPGIYFDGSDDVIDSGSVDVSDTDDVTIEAWGYYDATSYWWRGFIGQNSGQNDSDYEIDVSDTGQFRTWVNDNQWTPAQYFPQKSWFHVAFTYSWNGPGSGNSWRYLYFNGVLVYSDRSVDPQIPNDGTFKIGDNWDPDLAWLGIIDEVRVSNSQRSEDWIKLEYMNQRPDQGVGARLTTITVDP